MVALVENYHNPLSKGETIGFIVSIVTLVALLVLSSIGLCLNHPERWLKMDVKACKITASIASGGLKLAAVALGLRVRSKSPTKVSGKS